MTGFRTLDDMGEVAGARVLVRADLNVPMQGDRVTDATRIDSVLATVRELAAKGAKVILLSHRGRPKGTADPALSLAPVGPVLADRLGQPVGFAGDCVGQDTELTVQAIGPGDVVLLENLRYHAGEEANDPAFADALARLGDLYVNDAFSCAHRAHASVAAIAERLPSYAGRGLERELSALDAALGQPRAPVLALVGGAKVSTKLSVLRNLVDKVDMLVIGGGMANTFLHAQGTAIGTSLCEADLADTAREIEAAAAAAGCRLILPVDAVIAQGLGAGIATQTVPIDHVPDDRMILDIGPTSRGMIAQCIQSAHTIVWNGPMGAFEVPPFDAGTNAVAAEVAKRTTDCRADDPVLSVAGGGDTVAALAHAGVTDKVTFVSTAGGAFLEWMEGKLLPGVEALTVAAAEETGPIVEIADVGQAQAVLETTVATGQPATLISSATRVASLGIDYFVILWRTATDAVPGHKGRLLLDCGKDAAAAHAALAAGCGVVFTGPAEVYAKLADIAAQTDGTLMARRPDAVAL